MTTKWIDEYQCIITDWIKDFLSGYESDQAIKVQVMKIPAMKNLHKKSCESLNKIFTFLSNVT